ncbi:E3 ubiquitin-protein ligase HRD1 [Frankliniella fusca]|uniref:E3 ubiquitin-protein ligase HRD1 n=1 Tax=Frankliniella fusca TaxID=407009 RepID=A0AAE1HMW8_9NEOP|nr:E3 ubiquitin-protein ligase HRD1 [Frankliniella fusca]
MPFSEASTAIYAFGLYCGIMLNGNRFKCPDFAGKSGHFIRLLDSTLMPASDELRRKMLEAIERRKAANNRLVDPDSAVTEAVDANTALPQAEEATSMVQAEEATSMVQAEEATSMVQAEEASSVGQAVEATSVVKNNQLTTLFTRPSQPAVNVICISADDLLAVLTAVKGQSYQGTSASSFRSGNEWSSSAAASAPRAPARIPSPDVSTWRSEGSSAGASAPRASARSPSPDVSTLRSQRSAAASASRAPARSPSPAMASETSAAGGNASTSEAPAMRSPSPDLDWGWLSPVRTASPTHDDFLQSSQRAPSPDTSILRSRRSSAAASATRASARSPSPDVSTWRSQRSSASASAPRASARSPSPDVSTWRSQRSSASASAPRASARSPSPDVSTWRSQRSSASASAPRASARSPSPDVSTWRSPRASPSRRLSPDFVPRRGTAAAVPSTSRSRSPVPDFSFLNARSSGAKRAASPKRPPPKKRGRPPKKKESGMICSICREEAKGKLSNTRCGHFFHEECLQKWVSTPGQERRFMKTCPGCGQDFLMDEVNPIFM